MNTSASRTNSYSVLMTVYYDESPLDFEQAIRSMLFQTVVTDDFVIVCDGPLTEELERVITFYSEAYPGLFNVVRLKENSGSGIASAEGLIQCKNELVARMDADDISASDRCEKLLAAFEKEPKLSIVGGQMAEFSDSPDKVDAYRVVPTTHDEIYKCAAKRSPINNITVMFRKSAALSVGNYNNLRVREDYHLWIRMLAAGFYAANLKDVLAYARVNCAMYGRRRGIEYFKLTLVTEKLLRKCRVTSFMQYVLKVPMHFATSVMMPRCIGAKLFQMVMRRKSKNTPVSEMDSMPISELVFKGEAL